MKILNDEVNDAILKSSIIGAVMGVLTLVLAEENSGLKTKLKESLYAIFFGIFSGLVMNHLKMLGLASNYLEWAVIGFVSYNQKAIRVLAKLILTALTSTPFETLNKIKELIKK